MSDVELENFIDLRNNIALRIIFSNKELSEFWISMYDEYPQLSLKAIETLLPLGFSYLYELEFSAPAKNQIKKTGAND